VWKLTKKTRESDVEAFKYVYVENVFRRDCLGTLPKILLRG